MKRMFFFGVIVYSALTLLTNDWPTAMALTDNTAWFWIAKCFVDFGFGAFGAFKMFSKLIHFDEEEIGVHEDDISVPDTWLYGLFGLNLVANFVWHLYEFKAETGAVSFYNSLWAFGEFVGLIITFVLYKHAVIVAQREMRKARMSSISPLNRNTN